MRQGTDPLKSTSVMQHKTLLLQSLSKLDNVLQPLDKVVLRRTRQLAIGFRMKVEPITRLPNNRRSIVHFGLSYDTWWLPRWIGLAQFTVNRQKAAPLVSKVVLKHCTITLILLWPNGLSGCYSSQYFHVMAKVDRFLSMPCCKLDHGN